MTDSEWNNKYKEYMNKRFTELSKQDPDEPMSEIKLLALGGVKTMIEDKELIVIRLPFHSEEPFVFYKESERYFKW